VVARAFTVRVLDDDRTAVTQAASIFKLMAGIISAVGIDVAE
jgi:hypothetical protein